MSSSNVLIDEGVWIKILPSGRSGAIRYVGGIGEVWLTQSLSQPSMIPAATNPILGIMMPKDERSFDRLIIESIWAYSPTNSASFVITPLEVDPPIAPVIVEDPHDFTNNAELTSETMHSSAVDWDTVEWYYDNKATGVNTSRFTPEIISNANHEVFARFTNSAGSVDTANATISPDPTYPIITVQPTPQALSVGDTLTLVSDGTGYDITTWWRDDYPYGGTGTTLVLTNVQPIDAGMYRCIYEKNDGKMSQTISVEVTVA